MGIFKKVFPQSPICFFSGKGYLLKTEGVNWSLAERTSKKNIKNAKNLAKPSLYYNLKHFIIAKKLGIPPVFDNIFAANMLGIWKRVDFKSHAGVFLPSELLSQYMCLPKTDDIDRTHKNKMMQISYLDIWVNASF